MIRPKSGHIRPCPFLQLVAKRLHRCLIVLKKPVLPSIIKILTTQPKAIRPKSGHIRPSGLRQRPHSDLRPSDAFRELLSEEQIEGDELTAVFDELLALKVIA